MISVNKIAPGSIFYALSDRRDLVDKLVEQDTERATPDALLGMIFRQQLDVHGLFEDHKMVGFVISGVCVYAKGRALVVHDVVTDTGVYTEHHTRLFQLLEVVAKEQGCQWIDFHGRLGWLNWAKEAGFHPRRMVFTKEV